MRAQLVSDFFRISNYAEAGLWFAIAAAVLWRFGLSRRAVIAAAALVLFGVSDIVETTTGAWWRPWWLFVWKAACVATLLGVFWAARKKRA